MMAKDQDRQALGMTTGRIETLTDGVFAIAMTLLVLNLGLPQLNENLSGLELHSLLLQQAHKFFNYALSFVLLAVFWVVHHWEYHFIKRTNRTHLWINIFILMFVALVPFSTSLMGDYPNDWMAELFFAANLFAVGVLFLANWLYATKVAFLVDVEATPKRVSLGIRRGLVVPGVSLVAMILVLLKMPSAHIYLLIPIILFLPPFKR